MNIDRFNSVLKNNLVDHILPYERIVSKLETDNCVSQIGSAFYSAISSSTPKVTIRKRGQNNLPEDILNFIRGKKHLQRKATLKEIIRNLDGQDYSRTNCFAWGYSKNKITK